jgi:hypothetical protein
MAETNEQFYHRLPGFSSFSQFTQMQRYEALPSDWFVVITDVTGSTHAIEKGKYKEVNAIGAASIVALMNAVKPLAIPYVFGGDGATACVPPTRENQVRAALAATRQMAKKSFGLELRIGMVPVSVIHEAGQKVMVGKFQPSEHFRQAMFLGSGLRFAEALVKGYEKLANQEGNPFLISEGSVRPDGSFQGFECRWNEIPSPHEETVAILVQALDRNEKDQERIYERVTAKILDIYGQENDHHPIRKEFLTMATSIRKYRAENGVLNAFEPWWKRLFYVLRLRVVVSFASSFMRKGKITETANWGRYKQILIENTDYRKFDECLRMVLSGTTEQRETLAAFLEKLRAEGRIVYGLHPAPTALMTCLIFNYDCSHVHFLDGSQGGYALAAREMKRQLGMTAST